jgi:hypothetical protein
MKKLILSILLVAGLFAEEDISYSISGNIGSEYKVKFITHFRDQNKKCRGSDLTKEIEVKSGDYNISIPLTHHNENSDLCYDYVFNKLEMRIKNSDGYSIFPILGDYQGNSMEICLGDNNFTSEHMQQLRKEQTAAPIYSGFSKYGQEGFRQFKSYSFMPKKLRTSKSIFRLTPKTDFICDTKGLFFASASLCQMKALLDTNGGLYHYIGEEKDNCHSLTHPDFGVDKIENSSLIINISHEKINDF